MNYTQILTKKFQTKLSRDPLRNWRSLNWNHWNRFSFEDQSTSSSTEVKNAHVQRSLEEESGHFCHISVNAVQKVTRGQHEFNTRNRANASPPSQHLRKLLRSLDAVESFSTGSPLVGRWDIELFESLAVKKNRCDVEAGGEQIQKRQSGTIGITLTWALFARD